MKIKIKRRKVIQPKIEETEESEIELERGDYVLIRTGIKDAYSFGQIDDIEDHGKRITLLSLGHFYRFSRAKIGDLEIPTFAQYPSPKSYDIRLIKDMVVGLENIINVLEKDPRYRGHANLIRRIAEAQGVENA